MSLLGSKAASSSLTFLAAAFGGHLYVWWRNVYVFASLRLWPLCSTFVRGTLSRDVLVSQRKVSQVLIKTLQ